MNFPLKNKIISDSKINALLKANRFCDAAIELQAQQKNEWELLSKHLNSLTQTRLKAFQFDSYRIYCQFNPKRFISTSADISDKTIRNRECFLCVKNLPEEQKGILIEDKFILLCNPFPIFNHHFTIAYTEHQPQLIEYHFMDLLSLAEKMNDRFVVFYNGPLCGASAPDHLHFQAGEKSFLPIYNEFNFIKNRFGKQLINLSNFSAFSIDDGLRKYFIIESNDQQIISEYFHKIYLSVKNIYAGEPEPMLNILCDYEKETGWRVLIFPRSQHRSSHYFNDGEDKILLSPASVDIGGVCILPREEDFVKINSLIIKKIFSEVFPAEYIFQKIIINIT